MQEVNLEFGRKSEVYEKLKDHFEYLQRIQPKRSHLIFMSRSTDKVTINSTEENDISFFNRCYFNLCFMFKKRKFADQPGIWY